MEIKILFLILYFQLLKVIEEKMKMNLSLNYTNMQILRYEQLN